jgi:hypothetical protein
MRITSAVLLLFFLKNAQPQGVETCSGVRIRFPGPSQGDWCVIRFYDFVIISSPGWSFVIHYFSRSSLPEQFDFMGQQQRNDKNIPG